MVPGKGNCHDTRQGVHMNEEERIYIKRTHNSIGKMSLVSKDLGFGIF